jgi:glycosyltransferase involved in cell wall biosynthesis
MRVLHAIDTSAVGGGQTAVRHLLDGFRRSDVETELVCREGGPLIDAAHELGVRTHSVDFDKRYLPDKAADVARIVRDSHIDLIHSHGLLATYYCQLARTMFKAKVPLVYHQHGFHHHNHGPLTRRSRIAAERWLAAAADRAIAVSKSDYHRLISDGYAPESRVRLVHYGLPDRSAAASAVAEARDAIAAEGRPVIGIVGRLHPQKGVDTFLRAAALIREQCESAVFAVVGVGELEGELRAIGTSLGFNGNLRWLPPSVAGAAAMPNFDIAVLASRWEGLPLVLLEYMAAARPIVTTNVEGCLDAIGPAEAEIVPADHPRVMADAVLRLLQDPALAERRAAAARARFQQAFTVDVMVNAVRSVYDEVLQ